MRLYIESFNGPAARRVLERRNLFGLKQCQREARSAGDWTTTRCDLTARWLIVLPEAFVRDWKQSSAAPPPRRARLGRRRKRQAGAVHCIAAARIQNL